MLARSFRRIALAGALLIIPTTALAQSAGADVLFDQGRKLMASKHYAEAAHTFEQSNGLDPAPGTLLNLAECYMKLGRTASAWSTYREAAALAANAHQAARQEFAKKHAGELEARLSTLKVAVPAAARVRGLVIKRNGKEVPDALWGQDVPLDPGTITVEASAPGKQDWSTQIALGDNGQHAVIPVPALADVAAPTPAPAPVAPGPGTTARPETLPPTAAPPPPETDEPAQQDAGSTARTAGWIVGGVGVVGAAVGTVMYLHSQSTISDANCPNNVCTNTDDRDKHEQGRTQEKSAFVVLGVGGALIGTGLVLVLTSGSGAAHDDTAVSIAPTVGGAALGFSHAW